MIWFFAVIAGLVLLGSKSKSIAGTTPGLPTPFSGIKFPSDVNPLPAPAQRAPQASTTLTDYQVNLASAFDTYSEIYGRRTFGPVPLPAASSPAASAGGGSGYGGGGTGGGRGSIGCPVIGTEIITLGGGEFESIEFLSDEWVTVEAEEFRLTATPTHVLYTSKGVVSLSDVAVGDLIVTQRGERKVSACSSITGPGVRNRAMRIHVPDGHLYFAGGILSHNKA